MKKLTQIEFIKKCGEIHKNYYDYKKTEYFGIKHKIIITCPQHGDFIQSAEKHIRGRGCKKCGTIKQKSTCLEKYGTENPFSSDIVKKQIRTVMEKQYGGIGTSSAEISNKIKKTNIQKYGVENVFSNKDVIENIKINKDYNSISKKVKNTNIKKYGVECVLSLEEIRKKSKEHTKEKMIKKIFENNRLQNKCVPKFNPEEYTNVNGKYQFECKDCKNLFFGNLDDGKIPKCTHCFPYIKNSKIEYEFKKFVEENNPKCTVELSNRSILSGKELDIYIPSEKIAIEFDGIYYHSELSGNKNKTYHKQKSDMCEKLGIRLIHIFEDEWSDKLDIVKSRISSILKLKNLKRIHARKCKISEISSSECNTFLTDHHIQGSDKSSIKLGMFYKNELVSVMTFGPLRRALGFSKKSEDNYELYRFCIKKYHHIPGAANKLMSFFIKNNQPKSIITYADKRWSDGNLYKLTNFKYVGTTSQNYWYVDKFHKKRYHRFNFRKNILNKKLLTFDPNLTEWENMKANGYDRIWDCGHLKFIWESSNIN